MTTIEVGLVYAQIEKVTIIIKKNNKNNKNL